MKQNCDGEEEKGWLPTLAASFRCWRQDRRTSVDFGGGEGIGSVIGPFMLSEGAGIAVQSRSPGARWRQKRRLFHDPVCTKEPQSHSKDGKIRG